MNNIIKNKIINFFDQIKSYYGKLSGYSSCSHCGLAWNVVDGKYIPYVVKLPDLSYREMFPVCKNCFSILKADQILDYCKKLVEEWQKIDPHPDFNIDMDIVRYNINYMKR